MTSIWNKVIFCPAVCYIIWFWERIWHIKSCFHYHFHDSVL